MDETCYDWDYARLFQLRYKMSSGSMAIITAWESPKQPATKFGHARIDVELRHAGKVVFPRGATWCGVPAGQTIDDNYCKETVTRLMAMKPGDTDDEYFEHYTEEQLEWAETYGEELAMYGQDRYCAENGSLR